MAVALATPIWGFSLAPPAALFTAPPVRLGELSFAATRSSVASLDAGHDGHDATMMDWTRALELTSTVAMAITTAFGFVQFADEYGFHDAYTQTPCATGQALLDDCGQSTSIPHLASALTTAALGASALVVSTQVDFDQAWRIDGDWAEYDLVRWLGVGMLVVQAVYGALLANAVRFGWADAQHDFPTLQGLAAGHLLWGMATLVVQTYETALVF
jgi:hypothetical protein